MKKKNIIFLAVLLVLAVPLFPQTEDDFRVTLTADNRGVVINRYIGTVTQVVIPSQIQGMPVRTIGNYAFSRRNQNGTENNSMPRISSVIIPSGVTRIEERAFMDQGNLVSVEIPPTVVEIGNQAFSAYNFSYQRGTAPAMVVKNSV